jgi:ABC-type nitrate/sulfonate/bicarbonate transport system permease component
VSEATGDVKRAGAAAGPRADHAAKPARRPVLTGQRDYTTKQRLVIGSISVSTFFLLWELVRRTFDVPPLFLPALSDVGAALMTSYEAGRLLPHAVTSLNLFMWSMLLSLAIAVPLGLVIGSVDVLNRAFSSWLWAIYTAPQIVFLPLILLWAGITTTAKVIIIMIAAVPPATVIILEGVKTVEGSMLRAASSFGASRWQTLRKIVFPGTLPYIGTGVRMGVSRGLVGLFAAELFTAQEGLGFLLMEASRRYNVAMVFGVLGIYLLFCVVMVAASNSLEKRLSRWRE